jgi:hypothetical protein
MCRRQTPEHSMWIVQGRQHLTLILESPCVMGGIAAGHVVAAHDIVPQDLVGCEQGSSRQVRAQVDEAKLGAKPADAIEGVPQARIVYVAMPEALRKVSLRLENLFPLRLGFLEHAGIHVLDRSELVRLECQLTGVGRIQDVARPGVSVHLSGQCQGHALPADEAFDLLGQEAGRCGAPEHGVR